MSAARAVFSCAGAHDRSAGRLLPRARRRGPAHTYRADEARIDLPTGRAQYAQRFAIVEPVFANLRHNKGLARFTLRGRAKVEAQWRLFCLVHNIEKLAHAGYAA